MMAFDRPLGSRLLGDDGRADALCEYHEWVPSPSLAEYVKCLWAHMVPATDCARGVRVLPDGCIDVVWIGDEPPSVAGPATRVDLPKLPSRATVVGVRFQPGMAASVLGIPSNELLDSRVPLHELWSGDAVRPWSDVSAARSVGARLVAAEAAVADRLRRAAPADPLTRAAVDWLTQHPEARVSELGRLAGWSERHLLRRFTIAVGYGPKTFQRILRFQHWLRLAGQASAERGGLAELAVTAGYADQAHLTREATRLAGSPPAALLSGSEQVAAMSDLFKT